MAFDGGFLHKITVELSSAIDCHIDKLYQPSRDVLVFLLRKKGFAKRLIMCARPGAARIQFTEMKFENPAAAPMFCMLARKHFSGARLVDIRQHGLERVVELCFETTDEMGDRVRPKIVCELIGNQSNIILVDNSGHIVDAVHRSDPESGKRMILPGALYTAPEREEKLDLQQVTPETLARTALQKSGLLSKALLSTGDGFSPLIAREIVYRAYGEDIDISLIRDPEPLTGVLTELKTALTEKQNPVILLSSDGVPKDFSYFPITQYDGLYQSCEFSDYATLLDTFYAERDRKDRIHHAASDMLKVVRNAKNRAEKRLAARREELLLCADREELRIYGELLKANLYAIENGSHSATVQNYYDPDLAPITIPLNPALTPAANAAKYFKDYKKSYTAEQTLTELTKQDETEIEYLDSVLETVERSNDLSDLAEIRDELTETGYLRRNNAVKRKPLKSDYRVFCSPDGFRVLVGKNNRQNDQLTTRIAAKNDLWFHVKNIPGSHVIVCCEGKPVSEETIMYAANLAGFYSKASASAQVPVDYTPVKSVKKPNGALPGMVIYTTNHTVYVAPKEVLE